MLNTRPVPESNFLFKFGKQIKIFIFAVKLSVSIRFLLLKKDIMEKKRTEFIGIRLSEEEAKLVRERTAVRGGTASAYVRELLLNDVRGKEKKLSPEHVSDKRLSTALAIKARFKNTASQYTTVANLVQRYFEEAKDTAALSTLCEPIIRAFKSLEDISIELQQGFNEYLSLEGVKRELPIYRRNLPDLTGGPRSKEEMIKFTYMEKIQIIGSVCSEMQVYKDKFNNEKAKVEVTAQTRKGERKYTVLALRSRLPESVAVGAVIFAMGDFEIQDGGSVVLYADTVKVM